MVKLVKKLILFIILAPALVLLLKLSTLIFNPTPKEYITVGVVACGEEIQEDTIVLLKSILLSSERYRISSPLRIILLANDEHLDSLRLKVEELQRAWKRTSFQYELHPVTFPEINDSEWESFYKRCSSARLFLPTALPHIYKILYVDADSLVLGNLEKIWSKFLEMGSKQVVGFVAVTELDHLGYNIRKWPNGRSHPFYPPAGVNAGVMLMDLEKLRKDFPWKESVISTYKKYNKALVGDQDIINVIFYFRPDALYRLPCSFNYRYSNCRLGWHCKEAESDGIQILHGAEERFHHERGPVPFRMLHKYFKKFDVSKDDFELDLIIPFRKELENYIKQSTNNNNGVQNCENIGHLIKF